MVGQIFVILALVAILSMGSSRVGFYIFGFILAILLIAALGPIALIFIVLIAIVVWFCSNF